MNFIKSTLSILFASILLAYNAKAQVYFDSYQLLHSEEPKIGIGLFGGTNASAMDFGMKGDSYQIGIQGEVTPIRFLTLNVALSKGELKGGPVVLEDYNGMKEARFQSDFFQGSAVVRFMPFRIWMWDKTSPVAEFFTYIYGGLGLGYFNYKTTATNFVGPEYGALGKSKESTAVFIQELGIDLPIVKLSDRTKLFLNFNYRFNKLNSDAVDGYKPTVSANEHKDVYSSYNFGVTIKF